MTALSTSQENGHHSESSDSAVLFQSSLKQVDELAYLVHKKGASLSFREPATGRTPLHAAAAAGAEEQVSWFLANGAAWNQVDNDDFTPAELALQKGHQKVHDFIYEAAIEQGR